MCCYLLLSAVFYFPLVMFVSITSYDVQYRGTVVAAVQDLFILEVHGRNYICVLHADGALRVWDILTYSRVLCQSIAAKNLEGNIC